jgi:uncharacterized protein (TIGR03083 family)
MEIDWPSAVTTEFLTLADLPETLGDAQWATPSLCEGWRVREVVAHLTVPVRYSTDQFIAELRDSEGDFTRLSNRVAGRDAALPTDTLLGNLRDKTMHDWTPPGGGQINALNHVVIDGLDTTVPLGVRRCSSDETLHAVLDDLTAGDTHAHFGFNLDGLSLRAIDMDWSYGSGTSISGAAEDLALLVCGRRLPAGRVNGELSRPGTPPVTVVT